MVHLRFQPGDLAGGALIGPNDNVRGVLASPQNVRSLSDWQALFSLGYAQSDPVDPDPFGSGRAAMDWSGHWMLRSHLARKGSHLGVMPLPRAGLAQAAPCGSWCWAVSARTDQQRLAGEWLRWVTSTASGVVPMAVPSRRSLATLRVRGISRVRTVAPSPVQAAARTQRATATAYSVLRDAHAALCRRVA